MGRKKGFTIGEFTIGKTRNVFYPTAKVFGDANAMERWAAPTRALNRTTGWVGSRIGH